MKKLMCALAACFAVTVHAETAPADAAGFTGFGAQAMRAALGPEVAVKVKGPLTLSIDELQLNLDRVYAFCGKNPAQCNNALAEFSKRVSGFLKERNAPIDTKAVLLAIRSSEYLKRAQAALGSDAPALAVHPLAEGLVAVAMFDTHSAARPLNAKDVARLSLSDEQLFALATRNLQTALGPLSSKAKPVGSGQIGTLQGGYYEASRLALTAEWAGLASAQNGTLLVAAPSPDVILYISESSPAAVDALRMLAKSVASKSQSPLSLAVFKWTADGWVIQ